jgi:hypothetical protein
VTSDSDSEENQPLIHRLKRTKRPTPASPSLATSFVENAVPTQNVDVNKKGKGTSGSTHSSSHGTSRTRRSI